MELGVELKETSRRCWRNQKLATVSIPRNKDIKWRKCITEAILHSLGWRGNDGKTGSSDPQPNFVARLQPHQAIFIEIDK